MLNRKQYLLFFTFFLINSCYKDINSSPKELIGIWSSNSADYSNNITIEFTDSLMRYQIGRSHDTKVYQISLNDMHQSRKVGSKYEFTFYNEHWKENVRWSFTKNPKYGMEKEQSPIVRYNKNDTILFQVLFIDREVSISDKENYAIFWRALPEQIMW